MYVQYEVLLAVVTDHISIILNVSGISKFVNYVNTVHMVLLVVLDRFIIVGNLYIIFGITMKVFGFVLFMLGVGWQYIDTSSY
jgi:hypothetical protein